MYADKQKQDEMRTKEQREREINRKLLTGNLSKIWKTELIHLRPVV